MKLEIYMFNLFAQALKSVLRDNFAGIGTGAAKMDSGEFAFQESGTKRVIFLMRNLDLSFFPGQRVDMSMTFKSPYRLQCWPMSKLPRRLDL